MSVESGYLAKAPAERERERERERRSAAADRMVDVQMAVDGGCCTAMMLVRLYSYGYAKEVQFEGSI